MATSNGMGQQAQGSAREADLQLVERCRRGDLGAFEQLYKAHSGRLYSLACRMLGNPADAEDLLQEIFLSAHRKLDSFRGESALGTWLYRLGMNQILDHVRSRAGRAGQVTDGLDDATVLPDAALVSFARPLPVRDHARADEIVARLE